jgi:hypothetical protein
VGARGIESNAGLTRSVAGWLVLEMDQWRLHRTTLPCVRVGRFGLVTTFHQSVTTVTVPHLQCNVFQPKSIFDMRCNCNELKNIVNYNISIALAANIFKHSTTITIVMNLIIF